MLVRHIPTSDHLCPGCGGVETKPFFELPDVPVNCCVLWSDADQAKECQRSRVRLAACKDCGLVFNCTFDGRIMSYEGNYDNALDFSFKFQEYTRTLVDRLCKKYHLERRRIVEIGCGKGEFLRQLCANGRNYGIGYDPSLSVQAHSEENIQFIKGYFNEEGLRHEVDFLCCRYVFEHLEDPTAFLKSMRLALGPRAQATTFYFEVPNGREVLTSDGRWDVIYEHVTYFTRESLRNVFEYAEFETLYLDEAFNGQYLFIEARPRPQAESTGNVRVVEAPDLGLWEHVDAFADGFDQALGRWSESLLEATRHGKTLAFWGVGSKGVTFLNVLRNANVFTAVVDVNPGKHGMYVPGTGQQIRCPDSLKEHEPDYVVLLNPRYRDEVAERLDSMGLATIVITNPAAMHF